jgi:outer membrane protein assembly factor BamB
MRLTHPAAVFALALIGCPLTLPAQQRGGPPRTDWPQWRGPNRDNVSTEGGLLRQWPENGPPLAWKATGVGVGYSSVSVAGERIFTMGDGADSSYVHELRRDGGNKVWSAKVGRPGGNYAGTRSTPTVAGDRVYAMGQWGDLVCLDAATGREHWRKSMEKDLGGRMMSDWGYAESVLVDGENVVCTPGGGKGTVAALNKDSGQVVWRSRGLTDSASYASLVPAEMGGRRQYVVLTDASVAGVAADNGSVLWRAPRKGEVAVVPTPVVSGGHVFVTSGYNVGCNLFRVADVNGRLVPRQVYANKDLDNHHGGVVLVGDCVYGTTENQLVCMDLKSGKVKWKNRSVGKGAVAYADGHLYVRGQGEGTVALVEATPDEYREKGRLEQPDRSSEQAWAHPVVAGGKLYLRDQDVLLCYDVAAH